MASLRFLSSSMQNPVAGLRDLVGDIKMGMKYVMMNHQSLFLTQLLRRGGATNEIRNLARRVLAGVGGIQRERKEIKHILQTRIQLKQREIQRLRMQWEETSRRAEWWLWGRRELKREYLSIKREELRRVWQRELGRGERKLQWLMPRREVRDWIQGIPNDDKVLERRFGNPQLHGLIMDGIQATPAVKAFMALPAKFRVFQPVDRKAMLVESEANAAKKKWSVIDCGVVPGDPKPDLKLLAERRERENDGRLVDADHGTIDLSRLRPSDFLSNKFLKQPPPLPQSFEIRIEQDRETVMETFDEYVRENCGEEGLARGSMNLSSLEERGREEILEGIKKKGWVLGNGDKSGWMTLDTTANYARAMAPHLEAAHACTYEDVAESEKTIYAVSKALCRGLEVGGDGDNMERISESMKVVSGGVPVLQGLRKDHKKGFDPAVGPPCRPLLNAKLGPNANLGNLIARVLRPLRKELAEETGTELLNTESLLHSMEVVNRQLHTARPGRTAEGGRVEGGNVPQPQRAFRRRGEREPNLQGEGLVVGSMDVSALYPSCKKASCCSMLVSLIRRSKLHFPKVHRETLLMFVALARRGERPAELEEFLPTPKPRTTLRSWHKARQHLQFRAARRPAGEMNEDQERQLVGMAVAAAVETVFDHHYFKFDGKVYRQLDGACIGMDLAVELCAIYMLVWDTKFLGKLDELGVVVWLYKRYVDDCSVALPEINRGWRFNSVSGTMEFDLGLMEEQRESGEGPDKRTFDVLLDIANSIDSDIQFTAEVPSTQPNGRLPMLDTEVWVEDMSLRHSFYKKPCANPYTILYRSAMSGHTKRTTLFQEGMRRLVNICPEAMARDKVRVLSEYNNMMRVSGYDGAFRQDILEGILAREREVSGEVEAGTRVRYRDGRAIQRGKQGKLGKYNNTWFLNGVATSTLKVQCTPGGGLGTAIRARMRGLKAPDGGEVKVVELGGTSVQAGLRKGDPFRKMGDPCPFPQMCLADGKTNCESQRVVYRLQCEVCEEQGKHTAYLGTTGHSFHKRTAEHLYDLTHGVLRNPLTRHFRNEHPDVVVGEGRGLVAGRVVGEGSIKYNLDRFLREALEIEEATEDRGTEMLNGRGEWGRVTLTRLAISQQ